MKYTQRQVADIFGWDIATWSKSLALWDESLSDLPADASALELGAGKGGLSLFLALKGMRVVCSDISSPEATALPLHARYSVADRVRYEAIDATSIPYDNNNFDVLAFKSMLGAVGRDGHEERITKAIREMVRVLKPGGVLLFAENLSGSPMHMFLRRRFVRWGQSWGYLSLDDLERCLSPLAACRIQTTGFLATLGRSEWQRAILHRADLLICPFVSRRHHYVAFGWARK